MARTYKRDSNGRFAGGGGGSGGGRPAARSVSRGTNRLTRDNAGKITSVGGNGATARGGRLRTAAGNQRATQTARVKGGPSGVMKGRVTRNPGAMGKAGAGSSATKNKIGRTGKVIAIKPKTKIRKSTGLDAKFEALTRLKGAEQFGARGKMASAFLPDKLMTPQRRKALGLGNFRDESQSDRWRASMTVSPNGRRGYIISPRGGVKANDPVKVRAIPNTIKGTVKRNPQVGAKLAGRGKGKVAAKGRSLKTSEAMPRRSEAMLRRGIETGNRAQQYLRDRGSMQAKLGTRLSAADGRAGRVVYANRNRLAYYANQRLNEARRAGRLQ